MDMTTAQIMEKLNDHDEILERIDKRFDQVDKRFDILAIEVSNIHTRMDGLEGSMKQVISQNLEFKDQMMKILIRHDQEPVFLNKRVKRIENN